MSQLLDYIKKQLGINKVKDSNKPSEYAMGRHVKICTKSTNGSSVIKSTLQDGVPHKGEKSLTYLYTVNQELEQYSYPKLSAKDKALIKCLKLAEQDDIPKLKLFLYEPRGMLSKII